ncbi:hypothetical protein [Paraburkholderia terrae]|uniref:hypothetical protein n=1 Tax=Paraburkholderia terrae TaxID=311230 RepID=UPI0012E07C61|nr:hypothetical protein [Paraburkholderia terrae]
MQPVARNCVRYVCRYISALPTALSPLNAKNEDRAGTSWRLSRNPPHKSDKVLLLRFKGVEASLRNLVRVHAVIRVEQF